MKHLTDPTRFSSVTQRPAGRLPSSAPFSPETVYLVTKSRYYSQGLSVTNAQIS